MKANAKNEKEKRAYFRWLKEAKGYSEATVITIERAIYLYEEFSGYEDLGRFNRNRAVSFKAWLEDRQGQKGVSTPTTMYHVLRHLRSFFAWLATRPGYKSRIVLLDIEYLALDRKKVQEIHSPRPVRFPSLEYVKQLTDSFKIESEIDQRDQALIAFLLLSGMRDSAVASLPMRCFDRGKLTIKHDPSEGVKTKFGKAYVTCLFRFDEQLLGYVRTWAEYLEKERLFSNADPLFPRTRVIQAQGSLSFSADGVEPVFWKGAGSIREMLKTRAKAANLEYYRPHAFRHAAVHLAFERCDSPEEIKAVSQNLGHEQVMTTLMTYGNLDTHRVEKLIRALDFSVEKKDRKAKIDAMKRLILELERS
jgi:integrase/recombinase XerD